jgi:hypothetical protein
MPKQAISAKMQEAKMPAEIALKVESGIFQLEREGKKQQKQPLQQKRPSKSCVPFEY